MDLKKEFKDFMVKKGYDRGTADDYVSHISRISDEFEVKIGDLFDPNSISMYGRLDDDTLDETNYKRWRNALKHYIDFLNQL